MNYLQFYIEINCIFAAEILVILMWPERRVYLLKNMRKMTPADEAKENEPIFRRLYEASRLSNLNEEEMEEYRKSVLEYEDVQNAIEYASKRSEARGRKTGLIEGEAKARRAIIAQMLENGIAIPMICKLTGLSETEVQALS